MNKIFIALMVFALTPQVHANEGGFLGGGSYIDMCKNAVDLPKEYGGESDLKGNPKLHEYCSCFSKSFSERAMKALANRQAGKAPPPLEQQLKEELNMKNTCRKQFGLPLKEK